MVAEPRSDVCPLNSFVFFISLTRNEEAEIQPKHLLREDHRVVRKNEPGLFTGMPRFIELLHLFSQ